MSRFTLNGSGSGDTMVCSDVGARVENLDVLVDDEETHFGGL